MKARDRESSTDGNMKILLSMLAMVLIAIPATSADLKFRTQEIDATIKIGYGVVIADVNDDKKPDIVVCDARRVVWYENPTWKRRIIIEDQTPPDNVCIAPCDIDRDGRIDFFLGADWGRMDTTKGGTIHWMRRGKSLDEKWEVFKIGEEPTVHRMRVVRFREEVHRPASLVVVPLMGRGATKEGNWLDGRPVRILAFDIPRDPRIGPWPSRVLDDENFHVVHGFETRLDHHGYILDVASAEGISLKCDYGDGDFKVQHQRLGNQDNPKGNRGASEVKRGWVREGGFFVTVEPWHGNQIVTYRLKDAQPFGIRDVLDDKLRWGHGLQCSDLDGDGNDEIIAGIRDDHSKNPGERRGVRVYKCTDGKGEKWDRQIVDDGGIACEDLVVHDLNGDGRPDIIASGRQTGNVRIYWNETAPQKPKPKEAFKPTADEQAVLELVNAERKKENLSPLKINEKLTQAARDHSANMAKQNKLDHTLDEKGPAHRIQAVGYKFSSFAENIAMGQTTPAEVMKSWMESEGHKKNLLGDYVDIGIGVATDAMGQKYWTQVFATPLQ